MRATALLARAQAAVVGVALRSLTALAGPRHQVSPDWRQRPFRVLLLRYDRIGDMITSTSLVRAITEAQPSVTLDVLASPQNAEVIRRQRHRGDVVIFDSAASNALRHIIREMRSRSYDAILDGFVFDSSIARPRAMLMLLSGAPYRIGISGKRYDFVYNLPISAGATSAAPMHHVDRLAILSTAFGVEPDTIDWRPHLPLTPMERETAETSWPRTGGSSQFRFLVNISARGDRRRRWPNEFFAAVIHHLRERRPDASVLVIGLPADLSDAMVVARLTGIIALAPDLFASFALVASADLLLSPDTALTHAASAFQTPTIAMLRTGNTTSTDSWIPYRTSGVNLFTSKGESLDTIVVSRVQSAIDHLLAVHHAR